MIVAASSQTTVRDAVESLPGRGHSGIVLNVADDAAWSASIQEIDAGGGLDGLVAAAGVLGPIGSLASWPPEEFARTLAINVYGTLLALHYAVPRLRERDGAAVTFSGGGGTSPLPRFDAYACSKAAVVRLTENLAADGIRVNCVAPGFIATEMHTATLAAGREVVGAQYFDRTREQLEGGGDSLDDVCELVAFLLSDSASAIRGKLIAARWDPWRDEDFRRRLADNADLGALRRIDDQFFRAT